MYTAPNDVFLDHSYPALGASQPRVNIPSNPPMHVRYPSNGSQPRADGFEDHMRGMILSNVAQQQGISQSQSGARRPNQAQRRQQSGPINGFLPPSAPFQGQGSQSASDYQAHIPPVLAPHLRGPSQAAVHWKGNYPSNHPINGAVTQNQGYNRPPPQHRQLYNPASNGGDSLRKNHQQPQPATATAEAQVAYLDVIAHKEIPRAAITDEEFDEKQRLRDSLEKTCRLAVCEYEKSHNGPNITADSVQLKCFGSLSTTFATKASDMDLVLLSPLSQPNVSSPESELPRLVEKTLLNLGYGVRLLTKTRVPIIKFCEKPTPELAALLIAERAKFEKERDFPRPVKPMKVEKKLTGRGVESRLDPTMPQNRPNSATEPMADSKESAPPQVAKDKQKTMNDSTKVGNENSSPVNNGGHPAKPGVSQGDKFQEPMQTEEDDPSLLLRPDSERIRLYKLAIGEGWYTAPQRKIISDYFQTFVGLDTSTPAKSLARDRLKTLPNVIGRYREPPDHHLEFPKGGVGIQCDINFSNHLALHNSFMLKCYSLCDPRVRKMVIFVKAWSKKRKINSSYHGTLSSYGFVLMVLHYLMNIAQPPVLPNLQRMSLAFEDEVSASIAEFDGYNVQFLRNESAIEKLRDQNQITSNVESVGSLLRSFFHYYAQQDRRSPFGGFSWNMDTISLRTLGGIISKQAKGWTGAKTETVELKGPGPQQTKEIRQRYLFAIEDPFETEHNIARTVVHNGIVAIRDEFRRAHKLIENGGILPGKGHEDLFAEAEDRENLQRSLFGPRPRPGTAWRGNGRSNAGNGGAARVASVQ
jgi:terminal uridylyltransferase